MIKILLLIPYINFIKSLRPDNSMPEEYQSNLEHNQGAEES